MKYKPIEAGIIGSAGYTGGELLRLLLNHPFVNINFAHSKSQSGKKVHTVHRDLLGETELEFTSEIGINCDVLFLCLPHGESNILMKALPLKQKTRVIDLGQDFRLNTSSKNEFVYGLPELNRTQLKEANFVANPGCFATAIQLSLIPLAQQGSLLSDIYIHGITGSTGAGSSLSETSQHSWRDNNISVYKAFSHQHLDEINQSLINLQKTFNSEITFIPQRGSFTRGIMTTCILSDNRPAERIKDQYKNYYQTHPFVHISEETPDLKQVINTNKCILHIERHGDKLLITSVIDNLLKGASGQAVQNMNLLFGFDETTGLKLKPSAF